MYEFHFDYTKKDVVTTEDYYSTDTDSLMY